MLERIRGSRKRFVSKKRRGSSSDRDVVMRSNTLEIRRRIWGDLARVESSRIRDSLVVSDHISVFLDSQFEKAKNITTAMFLIFLFRSNWSSFSKKQNFLTCSQNKIQLQLTWSISIVLLITLLLPKNIPFGTSWILRIKIFELPICQNIGKYKKCWKNQSKYIFGPNSRLHYEKWNLLWDYHKAYQYLL